VQRPRKLFAWLLLSDDLLLSQQQVASCVGFDLEVKLHTIIVVYSGEDDCVSNEKI
jgi:hypothetical protein